ncbi:MAG: DUF1524 domain-containing protein [Bacteroidales bacterium]|nr:DUF1524 domain-containing protein [Bacteroidales bacterium]
MRQVYKMPANARMFILERMENSDNNERHDVVKELMEKNIMIEHIMPQTHSDRKAFDHRMALCKRKVLFLNNTRGLGT